MVNDVVTKADPVDLYRRATARAIDVARRVEPDQLARPDTVLRLERAGSPRPPDGRDRVPAGGARAAPACRRQGTTATDYEAGVAAVLDGLAAPGALDRMCMSPLGFEWPVGQAVAGTFMDVLIHTFDLARATGQDERLDPELVEVCIAMFLPDMPERGRQAGIVGPAVPIGPDAPPGCPAGGDGPHAVSEPALEEAIRALAHPGRRAMLRLVWDDERPATELAEAAGLSKSAASQHLKLLREAGWCRSGSTRPGGSTAPTWPGWRRWPGSWTTSGRHPLARLKATAEARQRSRQHEGRASVKLAVQELVVHAPIEQLFELLVDPELFVLWMAEDATLDPVPGGVVRWTHPNGDSCSGNYVEVVRPSRVVFTYGWERAEVQIPPGSTTVEIDLTARR